MPSTDVGRKPRLWLVGHSDGKHAGKKERLNRRPDILAGNAANTLRDVHSLGQIDRHDASLTAAQARLNFGRRWLVSDERDQRIGV